MKNFKVGESKNYAWISSIIRKDVDDIETYIKNTDNLEFIKKIDKIKKFVYDHTE